MPDKIKISVVLPVYNAGQFVGEAIQSILDQTYRDFELVLINDASTDHSDDVIRSFNDARIVYLVNEKNLGVIGSLNRGITHAKGEYIARMDADDISLPERLKLQLELFERHSDAVAVGSDYYLMNGKRLKYEGNKIQSDELKATLLFSPCFAHPTVMIRNVFKGKNLSYDADAKWAEDFKLWMELSFEGSFYSVPKPLLKYRVHPSQVSNVYNKAQREKTEELRTYYLQKCGFNATTVQVKTHHRIGNNEFIRSFSHLSEIEEWLSNLLQQNRDKKMFHEKQFADVMHKFWYDSCGYTSLGLQAYRFYFGSTLAKSHALSGKEKMKLLVKCLIRKFRN